MTDSVRPQRSGAVSTVRSGPVTTVILSRPHARNAVDRPTAEALAAAFREFDDDSDTSVAVLWGDGGTFCAGADLKAMGGPDTNRVVNVGEGDGPMGPTRMRLKKPVIAAVSGYAVAGGFELALWCDLRVVEESAIFGIYCRRWGVPLVDGGTVRLPRLIGASRAMDLILTGRPVHAGEAERIGLANKVVPDGTSRRAAEELALEIAAFPQVCLRNDRGSVLDQEGLEYEAAMSAEVAYGLATLADPETLEGVGRFQSGAGRHGAFEGSK